MIGLDNTRPTCKTIAKSYMLLADIVKVTSDCCRYGTPADQQNSHVKNHAKTAVANDSVGPAAARHSPQGVKRCILTLTPHFVSVPVLQASSRNGVFRNRIFFAGSMPQSKPLWNAFRRMSGTCARWHGSRPMPAAIATGGRYKERPANAIDKPQSLTLCHSVPKGGLGRQESYCRHP